MLIVGSLLRPSPGPDDSTTSDDAALDTENVALQIETNEGWLTWRVAALFGIIAAVIAVWKQVSKNRSGRDGLGYEKSLA